MIGKIFLNIILKCASALFGEIRQPCLLTEKLENRREGGQVQGRETGGRTKKEGRGVQDSPVNPACGNLTGSNWIGKGIY